MIDVHNGFEYDQCEVYNEIFKETKSGYPISYNNKFVGLTRHIENGVEWLVLINYSPIEQKTNATIKEGCDYKIIKGNLDNIEPFKMTIIKLEDN